MTQSQSQTRLFPPVNTLASARKASKQGVWVSIIVATFTAILALALMGEGGAYAEGAGIAILLSAGLYVAIAWGINRMSRFAAVSGLALYCLERVYMFSIMGFNPLMLVIVVFFALAFINAVRGTFAYHQLRES